MHQCLIKHILKEWLLGIEFSSTSRPTESQSQESGAAWPWQLNSKLFTVSPACKRVIVYKSTEVHAWKSGKERRRLSQQVDSKSKGKSFWR